MNIAPLKMNKTQILMSLILAFVVVVLFSRTLALAGLGESGRGFAWGGTPSADNAYRGMGWISMNNLSDGSGASYGVHVPFSDGLLSGYAWSEHYGWISFNGGDLAGCSPALSPATRTGNAITGGARIIAIRDAGGNAGGFDGCISLSGGGYGITLSGSASPYTLSGYAWSSDLGWINFSGTTVEFTPTASVSVTGCTIALGSNSCNGSATWSITDAESPNLYNATNNTQYSTSPTGTNVSVPLTYGSNNIQARNGGTVIQSTAVSVACVGIGVWDAGLGQCVDARPNLNQPNISHVLSSSFDPATGQYNYIDVTFQTQNDGRSSTGASAAYDVQFDRNNDGSYENTNNGSIPSLGAGAYSAPTTQRFNNVAFGTVRFRVAVDTNNAIAEANESDNERVLANVSIPPPNPGLNITADNTQLRNNESTVIRWSTTATYPGLECTVNGPGISLNPAPLTGNRATQPITAKSEYTMSCTETTTGTTWTDSVVVETQGTIEEI